MRKELTFSQFNILPDCLQILKALIKLFNSSTNLKIFEHQLRNAASLLQLYTGTIPFSAWIKNYFKENKKHGSKDRKTISHLCYSYFRLGKALSNVAAEEKILAGLFLASNCDNGFLNYFKPKWQRKISNKIAEKISFIADEYNTNEQTIIDDIFPWQNELSNSIDAHEFTLAHLTQPDLFLRLRPGFNKKVIEKLQAAGIPFKLLLNGSCIALANTTKIDELISLNKEALVQDYSSQQVASFFEQMSFSKSTIGVWDCCAASGGKSIMLYDYNKNIELIVSDIRESILLNLKTRFREAGIHKYQSFVADMAANKTTLPTKKFDLIICDVPCSGSGTWSRTPEQLSSFTTDKIEHYANLQKSISSNVINALSPNGYLLYITCSVFKKENEDVVEILQKQGLTLIYSQVIKGYDKKADTMFAALLRKER